MEEYNQKTHHNNNNNDDDHYNNNNDTYSGGTTVSYASSWDSAEQGEDNNNMNKSYGAIDNNTTNNNHDPLLGNDYGICNNQEEKSMSNIFFNINRSNSLQDRAHNAWKRLSKQVDTVMLMNDDENKSTTPRSIDQSRKLRDEKLQNIRNGLEFTLIQCLIAVVLYIIVSIIAFCYVFDNFTLIDSMYFAVVTFTTIGYGDLVPDNTPARIFTCFFALAGVSCLGIALGVIGNQVIEAQAKAVEKAKDISKKRTLALFRHDTNKAATIANADSDDEEFVEELHKELQTEEEQQDKHLNDNNITKNLSPSTVIIIEFIAVIILLIVFAQIIADDPGVDAVGWDQFGNALYFAIITSSTVGYGDFAPKTQHGRLFAVFFIPLAVGAMGHWLSIVAGTIIEQRQTSYRQQLESKELTLQDIDIMDEDGDGQVTQLEFLEFMLVALNKVDKQTLDSLREYFQRLDADGTGTLPKEDLIESTKKKLKSVNRKLELYNYKKSLLQAAEKAKQNQSLFWGSLSFSNND